MEDDSEEYDFQQALGGKKEADLDSFDDDFGEEDGEEEDSEEGEQDWDKIAEESKRAVFKRSGKNKLHKKKGVCQSDKEPRSPHGHRERGLQDHR